MRNPVEAVCPILSRAIAPLALIVFGALAAPTAAQVFGPGWAPGFGDLRFSTTPSEPSVEEEISLAVTRLFGDPGQQLLWQSISIDGFTISADILMQDLHYMPDTAWPQVVVEEGADFDLGMLDAGTYEVNASVSFLPWPYTEADLADFSLYEALSFIQSLSLVSGTYEFEVSGITNTSSLEGDYNRDGVVDAADYTVWRDAMANAGDADGNGDGLTNDADRLFWANRYGETDDPAAAIPEPSSAGLCLLLIAGAGGRLGLRRSARLVA